MASHPVLHLPSSAGCSRMIRSFTLSVFNAFFGETPWKKAGARSGPHVGPRSKEESP